MLQDKFRTVTLSRKLSDKEGTLAGTIVIASFAMLIIYPYSIKMCVFVELLGT